MFLQKYGKATYNTKDNKRPLEQEAMKHKTDDLGKHIKPTDYDKNAF